MVIRQTAFIVLEERNEFYNKMILYRYDLQQSSYTTPAYDCTFFICLRLHLEF